MKKYGKDWSDMTKTQELNIDIDMGNISLNELREARDVSLEIAKILCQKDLKPEQELLMLSSLLESFNQTNKILEKNGKE